MNRGAYYNEFDPFAAEWLRRLILFGHIAPGDVDERSIADVRPDDLRGYAQAHFFAGIGGWSHALRLAGWDDDRPVWTGSCPCQPFSAAGRGAGFDDERHLWPVWQRLVAECRPPTILGEQVASKAADPWVELVQSDLEALGYAFGAVPIPAAGIGAPHIRDRLWWVADAGARGQREQPAEPAEARGGARGHALLRCGDGRLADAGGAGLEGRDAREVGRQRQAAERGGGVGGVADTEHDGQRQHGRCLGEAPRGGEGPAGERERLRSDPADGGAACREPATGPLHGFWRDADWLLCRDGKWRPVEPGTFPLAHGAASRVGRLRAYGNAIVAPLAAEFIAVAMECIP